MKMKNNGYWKIFLPLTVVIAGFAFVPAIVGEGVTEPNLFGIPRTLWVSMGISLCIYVVLIAAMIMSKES